VNSDRYDTLYEVCGELIGTLDIIQLDTINKIISGTFDLKLVELDPPNMNCLEITKGRFDLQE